MSIDALDTIRTESERSADALATTDPEQKVPTCPEWTASDLLWHLVEVQEFWTAILAGGATTEEEVRAIEEAKAPRPEGTDALLARRDSATAALLAQLEQHADEEPAWFWYSAEQTVGVTRRMQTHEAGTSRSPSTSETANSAASSRPYSATRVPALIRPAPLSSRPRRRRRARLRRRHPARRRR